VRDLTCCGVNVFTPAVEVVLHSSIFLSLNVLLNYFSKLYLSADGEKTVFGPGLGYEFPLMDSVTDCAFCTVFLLLVMWVVPSTRHVSLSQFWQYKYTLTFLMVFHVASIVLNNLSLVWLGLSINQIIKGASPLPTMFFTFMILGTRYRWQIILSVLCLTAGCVVAVPPNELNSSLEGILAAVVAMISLSIKQVIYEMLLANSSMSGLNPFAITFWQFALGGPFLLTLWGLNVNNERAPVAAYWHDRPHTALLISTVSAGLAMLYNLSTLNLTKVTSALTLNIVSSIKFVLVIIIPGVIEGDFVAYNWVGVGMYFAFLCIYSYLKLPREVQRYEEALKLDDDESDRFFLQPGGRYIQKQQRTGFMYVYGGSFVSYPMVKTLLAMDERDELWGHHIAQRSDEVVGKGCFDCFGCGPVDEYYPSPPPGGNSKSVQMISP